MRRIVLVLIKKIVFHSIIAHALLGSRERHEHVREQRLVRAPHQQLLRRRFRTFLVLFHRLGKRVQDWWPGASCGLLGYDMSRSHSIMRIATTASPVSGMEVRERAQQLRCIREWSGGRQRAPHEAAERPPVVAKSETM